MSLLLPGIGISLIHSAGRRLRVETVTNFDSFLGLKPAWDSLVSIAADNPFVGHEWIRTWWESFGANRTMHIVLVKEGNALVGIAPMLEEIESFYGFKMRKLSLIWNKHVPRCDFIVSGQRSDIYRTLWDYLAAQSRRWDLLLLPQLPEGSPTLTHFKEMAKGSGFVAATGCSDASPYVPISGKWEDYYESLPLKHRWHLTSRTQRLASQGKVQLEHLSTDGDDVNAALDEGFQIEASGANGAGGNAHLYDAKVNVFYSRLARTSGMKNTVRLRFLRAGGKRIAFDFSICHAKSMYHIKGGHLPEYSDYSPVNILASMSLEHCFREGLQRYDFLGKEEEWKTQWGHGALSHHWMFVYTNNPRTAVFHAMKFRLTPMMQELGQTPDVATAA